MRILFLGENWYGSCARACCYALRRLGHDVRDIDAQTFIPQWRRKSSRALIALAFPRIVSEFNEQLLKSAATFKPEVVIAFKGVLVRPETLRAMRQSGARLYNYYPDGSVFVHRSMFPESLAEYDCVFYTHRHLLGDVEKRVTLRKAIYLPHGYDPELHHPYATSKEEQTLLGHDVNFIGAYFPSKERLLAALVKAMPEIDLKIWGERWRESCTTKELAPFIAGTGLFGASYSKAIGASRINLGIMTGLIGGSSSGDQTTTRSYEIPACGGFMLHERNSEVLELFEEGKEISCFGSTEEMAEKLRYYLANPAEREAVAQAGYRRCVPAYSYDARVAEILKYDGERA
jgi:spore maturation protein CgeB